MKVVRSLWRGLIAARQFDHMHLSAAVLDQVIAEVAADTGVDAQIIRSKRRDRPAAQARQLVMARLRAMRGGDGRPLYSLPEIGRALGRHHATILHGVRCVAVREGRGEGYPRGGVQSLWISGDSAPVDRICHSISMRAAG